MQSKVGAAPSLCSQNLELLQVWQSKLGAAPSFAVKSWSCSKFMQSKVGAENTKVGAAPSFFFRPTQLYFLDHMRKLRPPQKMLDRL